MFTGIVEEVGEVVGIKRRDGGMRLDIKAELILPDAQPGDSIAVAGCCLTVAGRHIGSFLCDVVPETLSRTTLGSLKIGDAVNLERPMRADGRFGGHIVQGHVDGVARVESVENNPDDSALVCVSLQASLLALTVEKGSITLNGVSLTVASITENRAFVALIPHTLKVTTLGNLIVGDYLNVEADILGKYAQRGALAVVVDGELP